MGDSGFVLMPAEAAELAPEGFGSAVRLVGDCMEPEIHDGEIGLVDGSVCRLVTGEVSAFRVRKADGRWSGLCVGRVELRGPSWARQAWIRRNNRNSVQVVPLGSIDVVGTLVWHGFEAGIGYQ